MAELFRPLRLRGITLPNRIMLSPMCQYSAPAGVAGTWHIVHLGSRAIGGAGTVMVEATAVTPEGRLTLKDTGLWNEEQAQALARVAAAIRACGSVPGIQLSHAGRRASVGIPWQTTAPQLPESGGWRTLAPSALPYASGYPAPAAMSVHDIDHVVAAFEAAARRAATAGFEVLECHMAHGYLVHEFLSPVANHRNDAYGGDAERRMALALRIAGAVRKAWPEHLPLFIRISAVDNLPGGWTLEDSITLCRRFRSLGVDLVDCSSGAITPEGRLPPAPGFQVPFAQAIREGADIPTVAVGMIRDGSQAEAILARGQADLIGVGRAFVENPYWGLWAARDLGVEGAWPPQYARSVTRSQSARAA